MLFFLFSALILVIGIAVWRYGKKEEANGPQIGGKVVVALGALMLLFNFFVIVPAGHVGVVDTFGVVSEKALESGINVVNPLASIHNMSVQTQEIKEVMDTPSKEGLNIHLEVSLLYRLNPAFAPAIYRTVGMGYADVVLTPQFRSVVRDVTASAEAKALYSAERSVLGHAMVVDVQKLVDSRGIIIEAAPLRGIGLPQSLTFSIEEKQKADQENQRMEFILSKEKKEADRKRIEATGIRDFQKIVKEGIDPQLLQWKGIEATEKLANSPNTKVIVIGSGKSGLPVILDTK